MFVTFLCSNTQKLSQNCLFFMFMSERTIKLNMREGGWRGNCSECHRERMKRSPVLNSNAEMKARIVKRQDIHHLTPDLKTLKKTSLEFLSSCLLRHKTPNCLKSLTAQHTHVKTRASAWMHDKLQPYRSLRRGYFQSMCLYRSTLKYFLFHLKTQVK